MEGWRCLAYVESGVCRLISRKQNQFKSFSPLAASVAKLKVQNAIIDGEVVCLDKDGKSAFLDLMRRRKAEAILYCFDLLWRFTCSAPRRRPISDAGMSRRRSTYSALGKPTTRVSFTAATKKP